VLPAALKKYKINNDHWQNYAMFICYGSPGKQNSFCARKCLIRLAGNRIERCLSYDEKPLLLFQKLKDAKKNPVFMLKHIKDIRSPIAVAQQKHALRKASVASETSSSQSNHKSSSGQGRAATRPPRLEVNDIPPAPLLTGTTPQAGWPEVMSPVLEKQEQEAVNNRDTCSTSTTLVGHTSTLEVPKTRTTSTADADTAKREMPPPMSGVSYAVAIYPYMAEQEDEFDVVV
jgi:bZIP factor